jgi:prevent-host-death family protein
MPNCSAISCVRAQGAPGFCATSPLNTDSACERSRRSRPVDLHGKLTRRPGLTRDTLRRMAEVTIRELRNQGGKVLDRVERGEVLTVTRDGRPVAQLRPMPRRSVPVATLLRRWRALPTVDPAKLRSDLDNVVDSSL